MFDAKANIARAAEEKRVSRKIDAELRRAARVIAGARNIAVSIVGYAAAEELLLNEVCALRDDKSHDELMRSLRSDVG